MKITNVNTYLVRPRWGFVEIETDEGITGWGEPVIEGKAATVQACVEEMKPYLIGADPMRIEDIWTVLYRAGFYRGGPILMSAIAALIRHCGILRGNIIMHRFMICWAAICGIRCVCTPGLAETAPVMWHGLQKKSRMPDLRLSK